MDPIDWLRQPTRHRILLAAEACFATHGFDATSIDDILAAAEVSRSHLYYHFPSKEALLVGLVRLRIADLHAADGGWPGVADEFRPFIRLVVVERTLRPALTADAWEALTTLVPPGVDPIGALVTIAWT